MNEWNLIKDFRKHFSASMVDENHRHEDGLLMGPFEPLVVHIDNEPVGCVDLRKEPNTVDGYVELAYIFIYAQKQGYAAVILKKLCELADLYCLEVELDAVPVIKFGQTISREKLHSLYRSFGFKNSEVLGSNMMTRYPNA
ncbi:GNAT family N-acetyltransferase [Microbulbifer sp. PAAF003]|uniref:GNAT family N-acetyltransferase n=1 Tax=Microbulbifer sp. PAAF003 TaxID=3243375 RepID=UPI0040395575